MQAVRSWSARLWEWSTGEVVADEYRPIRYAVGLGGALSFATWSWGAGPGRALGVSYVNALDTGVLTWWLILGLGFGASMMMIGNRGGRPAAAVVFLGIQACGGFMVNWAGLALQLSAAALVFAKSNGPASAWPKRILEVQLPLGYLVAVGAKLSIGDEWRRLHAFDHLLAHPLNRHTWPQIPSGLSRVFDVIGMGLELGAGLLLLGALLTGRRLLRRLGLGCSVLLHVGISMFIPVGLFVFGVAPFWAAHLRRAAVPRSLVWVGWVLGLITAIVALWVPSNPFRVL